MSVEFRYTTQSLGAWESNRPKDTLVRILSGMVTVLQRMESEGELEGHLCSMSGPSLNPRRIEDAERCRNMSFRHQGIVAAIELVEYVKQAPEDHPAFLRMASHGKVTEEIAAEFEPTLWVLVRNYAFLIGRHVKERGRDPVHFLHHAADMLELEIEEMETAGNTCPCCGDPLDPVH